MRKYTFVIYYTAHGERCKLQRWAKAVDDLAAFTWLCRDDAYQNLNYDQQVTLNMTSEWVRNPLGAM